MHLINLVSLTPVNKEVDVRLLRDGRPIDSPPPRRQSAPRCRPSDIRKSSR